LPAIPRAGSMAWTVTVPPLEVAVTGTLVLLRVIAAATFEATTVGVAAVVLVQNEKFVPVFMPSVPPAMLELVHANPLLVAESVKAVLPPVPGVVSVTVTDAPLGVALTLVAAGRHILIAIARFEAKVEVTLLVA